MGALLLSGLFFYDAFFVFKSDVMITVATQLEAEIYGRYRGDIG